MTRLGRNEPQDQGKPTAQDCKVRYRDGIAHHLLSSFPNVHFPICRAWAKTARVPNFIRHGGNVIDNVQYDVFDGPVVTSSDGGYLALGHTNSPSAVDVNWLLKLDATGQPTWQREFGCNSGAPGDYALGVSMQETTDGGYIIGGGVLGCGEFIQRALVEKIDANGTPLWAFAYPAGAADSSITGIRQTTDGGYIAVGSATNANGQIAALALKLDANGAVQWQRELVSDESTQAYFKAVQQTSDGGYVAAGESYVPDPVLPFVNVMVVAFGADGSVRWQLSYNNLGPTGPTTYEHGFSIIQTLDGGYLVGGNWIHGTYPDAYGGALLLKLNSSGDIAWQRVYTGGNPIYTVLQANDGYVVSGSGLLVADRIVQSVPWLAKMDFNGNYVWQYLYSDIWQPTGRPLSQDFTSTVSTSDGGFVSLGYTENYNVLRGELYVVKTDSAGLVEGGCDQLHSAVVYDRFDPQVTSFSPALSVQTTISPGNLLQTSTQNSSIVVHPKCTPVGTPTPTATATPTATPTPTSTATTTPTPSSTPTSTVTPSSTSTVTPRPTPTARPVPTPRIRPTPAPRPELPQRS